MIDWNPTHILIAHDRWYASDTVAELRCTFQ